MGQVVPVLITVYSDKSFDFVVKTPPAANMLIDASKVKGGSAEPNRKKVGSVTWDQIREIAEVKMPDLNAFKVESAMKMVAGTARSIGISVSRSEEHTSELQSRENLVCRLLLEKKKK